MIMVANVIDVGPQSLMVIDEDTGEEVMVLYNNARNFAVDDLVRITYNGQMTMSIPPQITATYIQRISPGVPPTPVPPIFPQPSPTPPSTPNEMRAVVLLRGRNYLLVRDTQTRQQYRVEYAFAHHFCMMQQVTIRYNSITMTNPPRINAVDITPVCILGL